MKVSKKEKALTRKRILNAASHVISEKGFKSASMREIARRAKVGDATIYNYFPTKEGLLYGYCEDKQLAVEERLKQIQDFHEYSLRQQLQRLTETALALWQPDRAFLAEVFTFIFSAPVAGAANLAGARRRFNRMVEEIIDAAIEAGEIPDQPYKGLLAPLYWDYFSGILAYWLKDDSEGYANTTQLVERSVEIIAMVLQGAMIGKALDLFSFMFRSQISRHLEKLSDNSPPWKQAKRRFMMGKNV
jgi:AcrR family transcriptional regulator